MIPAAWLDAATILTAVVLAYLVMRLLVRIAEMQRHGPPIESNDPQDWHSQARIDEVKRR